MIAFGLVGAAPPGQAVAETVKAFLLDWEAGHYPEAAALTTGGQPPAVAGALKAAFSQLGAADLVLGIGGISAQGNSATATFNASVDLGRGGVPWQYQGRFALRRTGSGWRVVWAPSVIAPGLRAGDRLAVLTTMPERAQLLNSAGQSLIPTSPDYKVGVIPSQITDARGLANALTALTGLSGNSPEMRSQILAAPSNSFLELIRLDPADYQRLKGGLSRIHGLKVQLVPERVFESAAPAVTGLVGTETARELVTSGSPYRPGITVGMSGLQQAYQATLAGIPTTEVVIQNANGRPLRVLRRWPGTPGVPVRTTIDGTVQQAAQRAVDSSATSAAIVAIQPGTGQILAVAQHDVPGMPVVDPLAGQYQPGQAFTIVSAATVLAAGVPLNATVLCGQTNSAGGQTFSNNPPVLGLGPKPSFKADFAHACATAFTNLILNPSVRSLSRAARGFGIGQPWRLPLPAFTGSIEPTTSSVTQNQLAADAIGTGSVLVSPLSMALVAGLAASGSWHAPSLVANTANQVTSAQRPFNDQVIASLRQLMRAAVTGGAAGTAGGAAISASGVFGQVGSAPLAGHPNLHAIWFVGYRHNVAFAVLVLAHGPEFTPAVRLAGQLAASLPS